MSKNKLQCKIQIIKPIANKIESSYNTKLDTTFGDLKICIHL
jgi:hypothetical protein